MAVKQITLRAWSDNSDVPPVKINQGDILSRTVIMTLLDSGGAPLDLTLSSVRVYFCKADEKPAYLTASIVNATSGIASVILDGQCTAVPGTVKSIVQVTGPNGENTFINGAVFTVGAINIEGSIISSNEFTALTDALAQVQGIANKADKSTEINGHSLAGSFDLKAADFSDVAGTDENGKVIKDPASYGKADGGAVLPHTLPTTAKFVQLLGGALVPIDLPAEGTLLEVGPNGTLVAETEKVVNLESTNFHDVSNLYEGLYASAAAAKLGNRVELRGLVGSSNSSVAAGTEMMHIPDSAYWPKTTTRFQTIGSGQTMVVTDVTADGKVILRSAMSNNPWVYLYGIVYYV